MGYKINSVSGTENLIFGCYFFQHILIVSDLSSHLVYNKVRNKNKQLFQFL